MLDFYIAAESDQIREASTARRLSLGGAVYCFLHRYFVQAALDFGDFSFLNPNEDTEIRGYQLRRLASEMGEALADLASRPSNFLVLVGWTSLNKSEATENWKAIANTEVRHAAQLLQSLALEAQRDGLALFAIGD